jgi:hypothetical protein
MTITLFVLDFDLFYVSLKSLKIHRISKMDLPSILLVQWTTERKQFGLPGPIENVSPFLRKMKKGPSFET